MTRQEAGRRGGKMTVKRHGRAHMADIGRRGALATWAKYKLVPVGTSAFAMVDRETGKVIAIRPG